MFTLFSGSGIPTPRRVGVARCWYSSIVSDSVLLQFESVENAPTSWEWDLRWRSLSIVRTEWPLSSSLCSRFPLVRIFHRSDFGWASTESPPSSEHFEDGHKRVAGHYRQSNCHLLFFRANTRHRRSSLVDTLSSCCGFDWLLLWVFSPDKLEL